MSAPGGAPIVRRRAQGLREANRTPATQPNPPGPAQRRQRGAAGEQENTPGTLKKAGGGGAGQPKPQRADRGRQRRLELEPAQEVALKKACVAYHDPERRRAACATLRHQQRYDAELPLSPPAVPCTSPECNCKMSYRQVANDLGLGSPSVAKHANYRASAAGAANAARRAEVGKAEQARVDGEHAASERAAAEAAARALLVTPQRDGDDSPPASSVGLATEASSCALVLLSLFESAIPPGAVAASVPTASAAYLAYADVPVWLVLQQWPDRSPQVRSVVHNHAGLFKWGAATVLELCNDSGEQVRCLCVEGRWCAEDGQIHATPGKWAPIGGASGEPLYFGQLDEPDVETRHLLSFDAPVLADSTHLSTFYFECAEARDHAAAALGAAWDA